MKKEFRRQWHEDAREDEEAGYLDEMTPTELHAWKVRVKARYSVPVPTLTEKDIKFLHPTYMKSSITEEGDFVIDSGRDRRVYRDGREIRHDLYNTIPTTTGKPHPFEVYDRTRLTYDEDGYLIQVSRIMFGFGTYNFVRTLLYRINENDGRELAKVMTHRVDKQGTIEPGLPIGEPDPIDFTTVPLSTNQAS